MSTGVDNDTPGLMMPPPLFLGIAIILAFVLEWVAGVRFLPPPSFFGLPTLVGLVIAASAVAVTVSGAREFMKAETNINPYMPALKVVSTGPYRFTRNPMYLGMVLFLLGFSLILSLEWGVILTPLLWLAYDRLIVVREEAYLAGKFGQPYRALLQRTRRWL